MSTRLPERDSVSRGQASSCVRASDGASAVGARPSRLLRDERGAVYAEYVIITLLVSVGVSAAVIAVGVPLLESFRMVQVFLGAPIP